MTDRGRVENALRNTRWGLLQRILNLFFPFLVRTILIHTLSASYAGLSSLFTSILSALYLAELGLSNAIVYHMYQPIAEGWPGKSCTANRCRIRERWRENGFLFRRDVRCFGESGGL